MRRSSEPIWSACSRSPSSVGHVEGIGGRGGDGVGDGSGIRPGYRPAPLPGRDVAVPRPRSHRWRLRRPPRELRSRGARTSGRRPPDRRAMSCSWRSSWQPTTSAQDIRRGIQWMLVGRIGYASSHERRDEAAACPVDRGAPSSGTCSSSSSPTRPIGWCESPRSRRSRSPSSTAASCSGGRARWAWRGSARSRASSSATSGSSRRATSSTPTCSGRSSPARCSPCASPIGRSTPVTATPCSCPGAVGLVVFGTYPVAPPRMLDGFVDTVHLYSGSGGMAHPMQYTNAYAAMPSFHVGWLVLAGVASMPALPWRRLRPLLLVPGLVMLFVVMATANHYLIDGVVGATLALVALAVVDQCRRSTGASPPSAGRAGRARGVERCGQRRERSRRTGVPPRRRGLESVDGRP